jgi:hypothetical protein
MQSDAAWWLRRDPGVGRHPLVDLTRIFAILLCMLSLCASAGATEDFNDLIQRQFEIYDPDYQRHHEHYGERLETISRTIAAAAANGRTLECSQQMFLEAKWLYGYTANWDRLEDKLKRIEQSLDDYEQSFATGQSPVDGMWGICYEEWFMRLGATINGLESLAARNEYPRYDIRLAADSPGKLLTRLQSLLISDIAHTGVDNRGELASLITTFTQGAFKTQLRDILVESTDLRVSSREPDTAAFRAFLRGAQDATTGYWGAWYLVGDKIHKTHDLSITYHIIAYTQGRVEYWPRIIETTRAIESDPYPYGWRHNGRYNNHNLYDVVRIYKFGWPYMSEAEQLQTAQQIDSMIDWSLANTLGSDDTFVFDPKFSDSLVDEYYFGVSFLDVAGYWQQTKRFWTDAPVDDGAAALCCHLKHRVRQLDLKGWAGEGAMSKLESNCGQC